MRRPSVAPFSLCADDRTHAARTDPAKCDLRHARPRCDVPDSSNLCDLTLSPFMSRVRRLAINAADHLVRKKRFDAAASILENYLSAHPESADIVRRLGRIYLSQGRADLATPLLKRALTMYGDENRDEVTKAAAAQVE